MCEGERVSECVRIYMCMCVHIHTRICGRVCHAHVRVYVCDVCVFVRESAGESPRPSVLIIRVSLKPLDNHTSERVILQKLL